MRILSDVQFSDLAEPIAAVFSAAGRHSFFSRADWYDLVLRFASEPGARPLLYVNTAGNAALVCRRNGERGVQGLTNAYSMEYGPVVAADSASAAADVGALAAEIAREQPELELLRWTALDAADPCYAALRDGVRQARWMVRPFFDFGNWYEDTRALDFRRYFAARPAILRNTYLRKSKSAPPGLDYRLLEDSNDLESLIADYEAVYRQSWKDPEPYPRFMPELMRLAARLGALRMGVIRLDGVPIAAQFWIVWNGRAIIYKLAHDERFKQLSPGTLLTMRLVETVLERDRPDEINFGRGDDPYKRLWLPRRRERWGLLAANPRRLRGLLRCVRGLAGSLRDRLQGRPGPTMIDAPAMTPHSA